MRMAAKFCGSYTGFRAMLMNHKGKMTSVDSNSYNLLLSSPAGISSLQLSVTFDKAHDRRPHQDIVLENSISMEWDKMVSGKTHMFNGHKFRYDGYILCNGNLCLHLGLTDYRTFVGTNLSPLWKSFLVSTEDDLVKCQHTSSPLGNGAIVETSDEKIILLERSHNVGEFPGYLVFPGGHPEPQEVGIEFHEHEKSWADTEIINRKIADEMFKSMVREVVEEIGVPELSLGQPVLIGIVRRELNMRPALFFFICCNLHSTEIQHFYSRAQDTYESIGVYTVSMKDLEKIESKMPGCHRGGFALFKLFDEYCKNTPPH